MIQITNRNCPTCNSPSPKLHPAMQFEGEVQPCSDLWHGERTAVEVQIDQERTQAELTNIAYLARDFVHEPENWDAYTESKTSNSVAWPPEFLLLAQAVEAHFGAPKAEG